MNIIIIEYSEIVGTLLIFDIIFRLFIGAQPRRIIQPINSMKISVDILIILTVNSPLKIPTPEAIDSICRPLREIRAE